MRLSSVRREEGFTMALVAISASFISLVVVVAVTAAKGDLNLTRNDLDHKQAYEAARAGLSDYAYHLNRDTNYWTRCTSVPAPSAVNQQGSTANRRPVPGSSGATYALELLPRTGQSSCSTSDPVGSMIEQSGSSTGTFRIRSTGYSGDSDQSIVATFKRKSFLDFLYFTQLETSDPVTYGNAATINGAYVQCTKTIQGGRYNAPIPNSSPQQNCRRIQFIGGDTINGPLHTNDALLICQGNPVFGRTAADAIEVSSPSQGWYNAPPQNQSGCSGSQPQFVGTYATNAPVLTPPPTNSQLANIAQSGYKYSGQTRIVLSGTDMTVTTDSGTSTVPIPSNGVVYVENGSCSSSYGPYTVTYPATSGCGNVLVRGSYSGKLMIAAENDIIIDDDLIRTGDGMLGLIANNFIRVYHPICPSSNLGCTNGTITAQTGNGACNSGVNGTGSQTNLRIDAAMLAINHSFIVDHYDCGATLGTLTVNGAIGQKFRGAVGTFGSPSTGYLKNYGYDDRLRYVSPPHFLDPVESAWHVQRETLDYP